ncbi:MAG: DNA ligase D, partial [Gammaproteobacteria bacterium]|nr:DNA ligase D [Gammaproteobacteria bacterium]
LYAFDLIEFDGFDLRRVALVERKALLKEMLPSTGPLRYSDHITEHGEQLYRTVVDLGLEGMIAKRADSGYRGGRSSDWLKIAVRRRDDFVVAGYTLPKRGRRGFGALLLGQFAGPQLIYAGRVGSGFSDRQLTDIREALDVRGAGPAPTGEPGERDARWIEPTLVCEVEFKEVTADGVLRAPVFVRLRDDKAPQECIHKQHGSHLAEPEIPAELQDDKPAVRLTNLNKVFWPADGYTKGDLADYYRSVAKYLLPYLHDRPVVLTRFPDGIEGKSFFQKDAPDYVPGWLRTEQIWSESTQREIAYFVLNDEESLMYVVNMGSIPIHVWSSRIVSLEKPDWCVLDLDPKQAPFKHVLTIARAVHALCEKIGVPQFIKTSGSTGMHVLIPLGARYTHEQSRNLGELLARLIAQRLPNIATVVRNPGERGGKVYIDYLQNRHGQTIAAPFSVRPLSGAPVSMPVHWREVNAQLSNQRFTINNAGRRLARWRGDPMREVLGQDIDLAKVLSSIDRLLSRERAHAP